MTRLAAAGFAVLLALAGCRQHDGAVASTDAADWVIVPGLRVGPIGAATTMAQLEQRYGTAVRAAQVSQGEGETAPGAVLFPDDSTRRVEITWNDSVPGPARVTLSGDSSRWHTAEGVTLGTSLADLERLNGGPFTLAGFGWDYGGTVLDWRGGALDGYGGGRLIIRLSPDSATEASLPQLQGDAPFSSDLPAMRAAAPRVSEIIVQFAGDSVTPPSQRAVGRILRTS